MRFYTGDVVTYKRDDEPKLEAIIDGESYRGKGKFEYSTTSSAWHSPKDLELVRRADKKSFKQLDSIKNDF